MSAPSAKSRPRTLRPNNERYAIYQSQGGICALCGKRMDEDDWEIDHIEAFVAGGETIRANLQAVHKSCNRKKGATVTSSGLKVIELLSGNKRPQIYRTVETIVDRWVSEEQSTSVNFPPRFGKSDLIRCSAIELQEIGAPPSIVLNAWILLVQQIADEERYKAMRIRYAIPEEQRFVVHPQELKLISSNWWRQTSGTPTLISMTIGRALAAKHQFLDGLSTMFSKYGKRVPVFFDESHLVHDPDSWGRFGNEIKPYAYIIPVTGTPVPGIVGFDDIPCGDLIDIERRMYRKEIVGGDKRYFKDTYEGTKQSIETKAFIEVTWKEAWDIDALAKANVIWVDLDIVNDDGEPLGKLSELPEDQLNGKLKKITESDEAVDFLAKITVDRLLQRQKSKAKTQALVVTGSDSSEDVSKDGQYNRHAERFKEAIERHLTGERISIAIATSVSSDGDEDNDAIKKIRQWQNGEIDILIVKGMGVVGTDVESCKVLCDASIVRRGPLKKQTLSRPMTYWEGEVADIILLADPKNKKAAKEMIEDQGGTSSKVVLDLIDTEEIEIEKPGPKKTIEVVDGSGDVHGYQSIDGKEILGSHEDLLQLVKQRFDLRGLADTQVLENVKRGAFNIDQADIDLFQKNKANSGFVNTGNKFHQFQGKFGKEANKIANKYIDYGKEKQRWIDLVKNLKREAKRLCGVPDHMPVTDIQDGDLLERLKCALGEAEKKLCPR
jgi:hypothetical protein